MGWVVILTLRPLYPRWENLRYPLDRRFGGPQCRCGRFGEEQNLLRMPDRVWIVQPLAEWLYWLSYPGQNIFVVYEHCVICMVHQLGECMFILGGWGEVPMWHDKIQEDGAALRLWRRWGITHVPLVGSRAENWTAVTVTTLRELSGVQTVCGWFFMLGVLYECHVVAGCLGLGGRKWRHSYI
jgi:hypothetical protein